MRIIIKKSDESRNSYDLTMKGMTVGKILALKRALELYAENSPVAQDIRVCLGNELVKNPELE